MSRNTANTANDMSSCTKRLTQELHALMKSPEEGISAFPETENLTKWQATIRGPPDTYYADREFKLAFEFSARYPIEPPKVRFVTIIFHPNVSTSGDICLDILKTTWSASFDVRTVLLSIRALLAAPNNASPFNAVAARLWDTKEPFLEEMRKFEVEYGNATNQKR